ncbi:hypothetical protein GM51_20945 [freshwater metagenome]|uniref:Uncharacterized protein n=1 Tax=freshwater metagenome TaxID=449393 RepID=A0A094PMS0_9ZZZZ
MHNNMDSRQQSFCRACGLIVVDSVCPYCSSTIDEPVIHKSKSGYQSRLTSITGVFLLLVAGITPAVVSARESIETATVSSTTTSAAPEMEPTSTTFSNSIATNESKNSKNSTSQKPKRKKPSPTTTNPPGPSGKTWGSTVLWKSADNAYGIDVSVSRLWDSDKPGYIGDFVNVHWYFPTATRIDKTCDESSPPFLEYEQSESIDGGTTVSSNYQYQVPSKRFGCGISGRGATRAGFEMDTWVDMTGKAVAAPVNLHLKLKITNLRTGEVVESPWVLVDWSAIP